MNLFTRTIFAQTNFIQTAVAQHVIGHLSEPKEPLILSDVPLLLPRTCRVLNVFGFRSLRKFRNFFSDFPNVKFSRPNKAWETGKMLCPREFVIIFNKGGDYSVLLTITSNWSRRIESLIAESNSKHYKNNRWILNLLLFKLQLRVNLSCWCVLRVINWTSDYLTRLELFCHNWFQVEYRNF